MRSLAVRWRLTAAFAAVMAVVLAATGLFVYQRQETNLDQTINRALHARAADVAALAQQSDTGLSDARPPGGGANRTELAQLIGGSGRVLDRTPGLPGRPLLDPAEIAAARRGSTVIAERRLASDQPVRLLAVPVHAQDQKLVIVVGQSLEERNLALSDLRGVLLVGGPIALVLASLAGYLLTGAALRPVEMMRRQAANISATDLDQRLPARGSDELGRLSRTLNEMLTRIHASVERERTLVSDASHELRTPLAVLRTELELIVRERPTGPALQTAISSAIEETDRLSQLADDLLLLARADDHQLTIDPSRLAATELLHQAADRARRQPNAAHKQITIDAPHDAETLADHDRAAQAIDNLLANALRHANTHVHLSARPNGAFVTLHVIDDGPGFPLDFLPHAWERFARADTARTEDGAGLGLAIVRTIQKRTTVKPTRRTLRPEAPTSGSPCRSHRKLITPVRAGARRRHRSKVLESVSGLTSGTQTGPDRLVGNADYPMPERTPRCAEPTPVELSSRRHAASYQDLVLRRARKHALCSNQAPFSMSRKACARAYSDGPAFDLPQDSPRIAPETPFARKPRIRQVRR